MSNKTAAQIESEVNALYQKIDTLTMSGKDRSDPEIQSLESQIKELQETTPSDAWQGPKPVDDIMI